MKWPEKLAGGVVLLLVALAVLQYRGLVLASRAEHARLTADIQASLGRFSQEFDDEIQRAQAAEGPGPPGRLEDGPALAARRISGWLATSPDGRLVSAFYRVQGGQLLAFDARTEAFEPVSWPPGLREKMPLPMLLRHGSRLYLTTPVPDELLVLALNFDFLQQVLLPRLVRKHINADYRITVVDHTTADSIVYPAGAPAPAAPPDASVPLLQRRPPGGPEEFEPPQMAPGGFQPAIWELQARHVSGGIPAAVTATLHREMAMNALVLALLAASIAALFFTTRAAHRLAALQMEFVSGVGHELRTPLAVIGSAADNLAGGVVATDEQVRRYGALIRGEGRCLTEMIEQVLSYSALQSGRNPPERRPVEIAGVIESAIAACSGQAEDAHIVIEREIADGLPSVPGNQVSLVHCVANLLGNALKYGDPGHSVRIAAGAEPGWVVIQVTDTGFGIDPSDLPHIFDAFYRGRAVSGGRIRGTGLGLNLVRRIAEAHGGSVRAESSHGKGSCFTLRLPAGAA